VQYADFVISAVLVTLFSIIFLDQTNFQQLGGSL
jgi:hypothetical protein